MKLVNYRCENEDCPNYLTYTKEMIFHDTETPFQPYCVQCVCLMKAWNFKDNGQRWRFADKEEE